MSKLVTVLCAVIFVSVPTQGQNPVMNKFDTIYNNFLCHFGRAESLVADAEYYQFSLVKTPEESQERMVEIKKLKNEIVDYFTRDGIENHTECQSLKAQMKNFETNATNSVVTKKTTELENNITNEVRTLLENAKESFCLVENHKSNAELCIKQGKENCYVNFNALEQEWTEKSQSFESLMNQTQLLINIAKTAREDTDDDSYWAIMERWYTAFSECENAMQGDALPSNSDYDES